MQSVNISDDQNDPALRAPYDPVAHPCSARLSDASHVNLLLDWKQVGGVSSWVLLNTWVPVPIIISNVLSDDFSHGATYGDQGLLYLPIGGENDTGNICGVLNVPLFSVMEEC